MAVLVRALQGVEPVEALTEQLRLVELPWGHTIYAEDDQDGGSVLIFEPERLARRGR
jgi:hypothetical protein